MKNETNKKRTEQTELNDFKPVCQKEHSVFGRLLYIALILNFCPSINDNGWIKSGKKCYVFIGVFYSTQIKYSKCLKWGQIWISDTQ